MSEVYKEKPIVKVVMLKGADGDKSRLSQLINDADFLTKEQIITLVTNIVDSGSVGDIDTGFVTTVKEQNHNAGLKFWVGTKEEYDALPEHLSYTDYIINDYSPMDDVEEALEEFSGVVDDKIRKALEGLDIENELVAINTTLADHSQSITTHGDDIAVNTANIATNTANIAANTVSLADMIYQPNTTYTLTYRGAGFLTAGQTGIRFTVPLSKFVPSNYTITPENNAGFVIRQNTHYLAGSPSYPYYRTLSGTMDITRNGFFADINFTTTEALPQSTNNDTIGIDFVMSFTVVKND